MGDRLIYHIGAEAAGDERLDTAPKRAYFYWKDGERTRSAGDYDLPELQAHVERLEAEGAEDAAVYRKALQSLRDRQPTGRQTPGR